MSGGRGRLGCRCRWSRQRGVQAVPDPTIDFFARGCRRGRFLAATAEGAERVRVRADRVRLAAGRCCSISGESDSSADQGFHDHVCPSDDAMVSFGCLCRRPGSPNRFHHRRIGDAAQPAHSTAVAAQSVQRSRHRRTGFTKSQMVRPATGGQHHHKELPASAQLGCSEPSANRHLRGHRCGRAAPATPAFNARRRHTEINI
jgi:hypothetical protein